MRNRQLTKNDGPAAPGIERARRQQINKDIPRELKDAVFTEQDDKKRTVRVSALPGKSWIKLNEWQTVALADILSKIVQEWSGS